MSQDDFDPIINIADAPVEGAGGKPPWHSTWQVLTPHMRDAGGSLGVVMNTIPPGGVGAPFHWHTHEDEVFYIMSGEGVLRYGESVRRIKPGDCISCPAGRQVAHQIANPGGEEDLVYLAIGPQHPHEVCGYPDSGKLYIRDLGAVGTLERQGYMEGEPDPPHVLSMPTDRAEE